MIVTLLINGEPLESRFIPYSNLKIEGYFEGLQKDMIEHNEEIMDLTKDKPSLK